jgi:hypothetical protein
MRTAFNALMRVVSSLVGLLMIAMGCVWAMQGLNVGPAAILQGPMVANIQWTYYGAILALLGVAQIVWSNTRQSG